MTIKTEHERYGVEEWDTTRRAKWLRFKHHLKPWINSNRAEVFGTIGTVLTIILVTFLLWFFIFATHDEHSTISGFGWSRQEQVEDYQPRHDSDWSHPSDAYAVTSTWEYHYSYTVSDPPTCFTSYDSKGNSSQTCYPNSHSVAVYDWYYRYTVDRWRESEWLLRTGDNQSPLWPPHELEGFDNTNVYGHRRLSGQTKERYSIYFTDSKGRTRHTNETQSRFQSVHLEQQVTLHVNRQDSVRGVTWPKGTKP